MDNYFFSKILLDLQKRLSCEVPELEFIDQQLGQLSQVGEHDSPPLSYPACLIDFPNTAYSELSGSNQIGAVTISFQLVFDTWSPTWHQAPEESRSIGLQYLDIEQKFHNAIQGWSLDYFAPLSRTIVKSQNNNDIGLRVRELTYVTEYEDYSTSQEKEVTVNFSFNGILQKD